MQVDEGERPDAALARRRAPGAAEGGGGGGRARPAAAAGGSCVDRGVSLAGLCASVCISFLYRRPSLFINPKRYLPELVSNTHRTKVTQTVNKETIVTVNREGTFVATTDTHGNSECWR